MTASEAGRIPARSRLMKLSDRIEVCVILTGSEKKYEILIDGEDFPWYTTDGLSTSVDENQMPSITVTIPTRYLELKHRVD